MDGEEDTFHGGEQIITEEARDGTLGPWTPRPEGGVLCRYSAGEEPEGPYLPAGDH